MMNLLGNPGISAWVCQTNDAHIGESRHFAHRTRKVQCRYFETHRTRKVDCTEGDVQDAGQHGDGHHDRDECEEVEQVRDLVTAGGQGGEARGSRGEA